MSEKSLSLDEIIQIRDDLRRGRDKFLQERDATLQIVRKRLEYLDQLIIRLKRLGRNSSILKSSTPYADRLAELDKVRQMLDDGCDKKQIYEAVHWNREKTDTIVRQATNSYERFKALAETERKENLFLASLLEGLE